MTSPTDAPGPLRAHLDSAVASAGFQLTKDNVLFFRDAMINEANRIRIDLAAHQQAATSIPLLGNDPVSYDASVAFPIKLKALVGEVTQFAEDMDAAAHALDDTARGYGITEDEITGMFNHAAPTTTSPQINDTARGSDTGRLIADLTTATPTPTPTPTPTDSVPGMLPGATHVAGAGPAATSATVTPPGAAASTPAAPATATTVPGAVPDAAAAPTQSGKKQTVDQILNAFLYGDV